MVDVELGFQVFVFVVGVVWFVVGFDYDVVDFVCGEVIVQQWLVVGDEFGFYVVVDFDQYEVGFGFVEGVFGEYCGVGVVVCEYWQVQIYIEFCFQWEVCLFEVG